MRPRRRNLRRFNSSTIQREIDETGEFSSKLENQLISKQQQIDKTSTALDNQTQKLGQMGDALNEAGVDTNNLTHHSQQLEAEYQNLKSEQEAFADALREGSVEAGIFGEQTTSAVNSIEQALTALGIVKALKEISAWLKECVDASIEFEEGMAGVRRTVGGTTEELSEIAAEFKEMTREIPITTSELNQIAEAAGQLGIAQEDITSFTQVMAELATTTDLTADNAATMLAQFANITGVSDYERLGSVVAELGDATATTASRVVDMSQGMAAAASIAGFSETDIMAVAAAVGSLGIESQAGSTAMSTLISTLYKAVETGNGLEEFAQVANMSAREFSTAWGNNAVGAMDAFIQGLNDTERNGKSAIVILDELGITNVRQTKAILGLASAGDLLSNTIEQGNAAWDENISLQAKADIMYSTTASQLKILNNAYSELQITVGDQLTPALGELATWGTEILYDINDFVAEHPQVVSGIVSITTAATVFIGALATYKVVTIAADVATKAFSKTLESNPAFLVISGLIALDAALRVYAATSREAEDEVKSLSAASREQYNELKDLQAEYENVCAAYGETSAEAQLLSKEIKEETAAFEENKKTAEEAVQEYQNVIDAHDELMNSYGETSKNIQAQSDSTSSLVSKLQELMSVEGKTAETKQKILSIVELLNEAMPELGLAYDDYADSLNMTADALKAVAQAEAERQRNEADFKQLQDLYKEQSDLKKTMASAAEERAAAEKELAGAIAAKNQAEAETNLGSSARIDYLKPYVNDVNEAQAAVDDWAQKEEDATVALQENKDAIDELAASLAGYEDETLTAEERVASMCQSIITAYDEAKLAARESIDSQVSGWDKMDNSARTSAWEVQQALNSQVQYLQNYSTNLQGLADRNVEGMDTLVQSLSDGSAESAAILAGLSTATDGEIAAIVASMGQVQEGKETLSEVMAALAPEVQQAMDAAIAEAKRADEMYQAGLDTGAGLVKGLYENMKGVIDAGTALGNAFTAAYKAAQDQHSPSRKMIAAAQDTVAGLIVGFQREAPVLEAVVKETTQSVVKPFGSEAEMQRAMQSYASDAAQVVMLSPALAAAMQRQEPTGVNGLDMSTVHSGSGITIEFAPVYNISGVSDVSEVQSTLSRHDVGLKDYILEVLEEAGIDAGRVKFK